ncbi:hypothetical protein NDU88_004419 [Pleurodeles waltl]|uniref:Uncharacterized protein n=1 Tax=Pleurodeles waltl TaxID=8319 RepID=A0AAV7VIP5_PLEWA|nr:hypothetical protein NDU88_004419 [Pleurodeles waltl]
MKTISPTRTKSMSLGPGIKKPLQRMAQLIPVPVSDVLTLSCAEISPGANLGGAHAPDYYANMAPKELSVSTNAEETGVADYPAGVEENHSEVTQANLNDSYLANRYGGQ